MKAADGERICLTPVIWNKGLKWTKYRTYLTFILLNSLNINMLYTNLKHTLILLFLGPDFEVVIELTLLIQGSFLYSIEYGWNANELQEMMKNEKELFIKYHPAWSHFLTDFNHDIICHWSIEKTKNNINDHVLSINFQTKNLQVIKKMSELCLLII